MKLFTEHPSSVGETYFEHLIFATRFGIRMVIAGLASLLHAIFPFIFQKTGSQILINVMHDFIERTPCIEPRVKNLSKTIERKMQLSEIK